MHFLAHVDALFFTSGGGIYRLSVGHTEHLEDGFKPVPGQRYTINYPNLTSLCKTTFFNFTFNFTSVALAIFQKLLSRTRLYYSVANQQFTLDALSIILK